MKFDNAIKTALNTLIKESYDEYDIEVNYNEDFIDGILVKEILPEDQAGDDVFLLDASISMPFNVLPGVEDTRDAPGYAAEAEVTDVIFSNEKVYRYIQATDDYVEVTPESIGVEVYTLVLTKLKAMAEEKALKEAYENIDVEGIARGDYREYDRDDY